VDENDELFPVEIYNFISDVRIKLTTKDQITSEQFKQIINDLKSNNNLSINVWKPIRIALTGNGHGPDIGKVAEILGNNQCSSRIHKFLEKNVH
ncbi:uncharacterized protein METZ01_LOCUS496906, partial [marine metagenome]